MALKYVLTEDGKAIEMKDGQPVVREDKEGAAPFTIDAIGAQAKITTITAESNDRRKKLGELQTEHDALKVTSTGLQTTVDGIDDKNKVKIEELKDVINKTWEGKESEWKGKEDRLNAKLFDATVGINFATSKVISGTVLPPDIAKATFGKHFNPDGTANDAAGNVIYSKSKPGEAAGFDEAMTAIIDAYPAKDSIMKGSGAKGSGGHRTGDGDGGQSVKSSADNIAEGLKAAGV